MIVDSKLIFNDVLEHLALRAQDLWFDSKEYDGETTSFVITDVLERFPTPWEVLDFPAKIETWEDKFIKKTLSLKVMWVVDGRIDKVEVNLSS
jgi:hypothetical protein